LLGMSLSPCCRIPPRRGEGSHTVPSLGNFSIVSTLGTAGRCGPTERWLEMAPQYSVAVSKLATSCLLEIPQWMFDAATCYGMHLAPTRAICIETLLDLKRLLAHATSESHNLTARPSAPP
jgi:hypothetical protein